MVCICVCCEFVANDITFILRHYLAVTGGYYVFPLTPRKKAWIIPHKSLGYKYISMPKIQWPLQSESFYLGRCPLY